MPASLLRIETSPDLPGEIDVVVIGGGIVGVWFGVLPDATRCARHACRKGLHRRRAIESRLGLVSPAEPRRA